MSTHKNYVHPLMHTVTHDAFLSRFRIRLPRFLRWLARTRKENFHPVAAAIIELGNERFAEDGYYHVSGWQDKQEKTINIETINLLPLRFR